MKETIFNINIANITKINKLWKRNPPRSQFRLNFKNGGDILDSEDLGKLSMIKHQEYVKINKYKINIFHFTFK